MTSYPIKLGTIQHPNLMVSPTPETTMFTKYPQGKFHIPPAQLLNIRLFNKPGASYDGMATEMGAIEFLTVYVSEEIAVVFYTMSNKQVGHIIDDVNLFPSDALVTKIRLLMAG